MDDSTFDDPKVAQLWINSIESESARVRDLDIYPRLSSWIKQISASEILEIGSGQGACSDKIDLDGRTYTGLEPSSIMVDRAIELYGQSNRRFLLGNAYSLPFADESFDAVFSIAVWHLLSDPYKAAAEVSRVLKDHGKFLVMTANPDAYSFWMDFYKEVRLEGRRMEGKVILPDQSESTDVLYFYTLDEIIDSLQSADLEIQKTETFRTSEKSKGLGYFVSLQGQKR